MALYVDSSFFLSMLLDEKSAVDLPAIWKAESRRVSSILLQAECIVTLRRLARRADQGLDWLTEKETAANALFREVSLRTVDGGVVRVLLGRPDLADCRTLDALHMATALAYLNAADEPIEVGSLDERMRALAAKLGFVTVPVLPA